LHSREETMGTNAKQIVRFMPRDHLSADDLRQIAAQLDADAAEMRVWWTANGDIAEDETGRDPVLEERKATARRLREIADAVDEVATDPETGTTETGYLRYLRCFGDGDSEVEVATILSAYGLGLAAEAVR